jgi:hypothetical protein
MTVQSLTIGKREFVLLSKRDFQKLAAQAHRQTEDDYWIHAALAAEADSKRRNEIPHSFLAACPKGRAANLR